MKRTLQRTLAAEKRKIERRLRNAVTVNDSGPVLSAPNLRYELAAKTKAIAAGGIGAIHPFGAAHRAGGVHRRVCRESPVKGDKMP